MSRGLARSSALALALFAGGACTDRDLTSTDPTNPPGQGARTLEVFVSAVDLGASAWFDTTLVGFAGASNLSPLLAADTAALQSRVLLRFVQLSGQVVIRDTVRDPLEFLDGRFVVRLDTFSSVPSGGVLSVYDVEQPFDARSATWSFAVDTPAGSVAWSVPGGALGTPIASDTFAAGAPFDTVIVDGDTIVGALVLELGAATDSLLRAWGDTLNPHPGLVWAVETATDDVRLQFTLPSLLFDVRPDVSPDTIVPSTRVPTVRTFIFDPPPPAAGEALVVGGLPAARSYFEVRPPDSLLVGDTLRPLRGSVISRAELVLTSRPPPAPYASRNGFALRAFRLADDVRVFGPKTPLAGEIADGLSVLLPDSVPDGEAFEVGLTSALQAWAATPPDSTPLPIRFMIATDPEPAGFGGWSFAGSGQPGAPVLRIVFTPPTEFELP